MRVRMRINITGYRNGEPWPAPGGVLEVDDHEGVDLIAAGYAKEVPDAEASASTDGVDTAEGDDAAASDGDGSAAAAEGDDEADEDSDDEVTDDLDGLDRGALLALADEHNIDIDRRLGERKLRAALHEALAN